MTIRILLLSLLLVCPSLAHGQPAVTWLSPLLGEWATTDTYHPVSGAPMVESATRTCRAVMRNAYIECETVVARSASAAPGRSGETSPKLARDPASEGGPDGTGRTYRFLINYNRTTSRFEMLSIWSNVPHKAVHTLTANTGRDRWIIQGLAVIGDDGGANAHWSELVIASADRIEWTGRRVTGSADPSTAPISFHETWTRRSR